jgi:6-phosphogluconolactonase (cycloisomerase 2 family)
MRNVFTFLFCALCSMAFAQREQTLLFAGSYTNGQPDKGIHVFSIDSVSGKLRKLSHGEGLINPSFLKLSPDGRVLYAVTHSKLPSEGRVAAFAVDSLHGTLKLINDQPSGGRNPVYLAIDPTAKWLVNANYESGSLSVFPILPDGSIGERVQLLALEGASGIISERQQSPHPHAAVFTPDGRYLVVPDLGADSLRIFRFDAQATDAPLQTTAFGVATTPGSGPRHFVFHPNGKFAYCVEELSGTVCAYQYAEGRLDSLQRMEAYAQPHEQYSGADLHFSPDGKYLYTSTRMDENSLVVFRVDSLTGLLEMVERVPSGGVHPRNFALDPSGSLLVAGNQVSGNLAVFRRDVESGRLVLLHRGMKVREVSCVVMRNYQLRQP